MANIPRGCSPRGSCHAFMKNWITYGKGVAQALDRNSPVVALESTIIAHGFPYPDNFQLALELEDLLRDRGITPATIGIIGGQIKVGLNKEEIYRLASQGNIPKASLRDIAPLLAKGFDGATTVASTMLISHLAGIKVFVTGGVGGVHRGGEDTMDVSADLQALSKYDVVVVCAGAKSVLDLPRTLEVLETLGVPVLGYETDKFPAFYVRDSGLLVDYQVNSGVEIAKVVAIKERLHIRGGILVTVPIPQEAELDATEFNSHVTNILAELTNQGVMGKEVTPYLLRRLHEVTQGKSVNANVALIKNNLVAGAAIAKALTGGVSP